MNSKLCVSALALTMTLALSACGGGGGGGNDGGSSRPVNRAPVANAGSTQSVLTNTAVALTAAGSTDADGDSLTYRWTLITKPTGSAAALSNAALVSPTFTPDVAGDYVFSLVVNDGQVDSSTSSVTVTAAVANAAPVANAGTAQAVITGTLVTLDGSASSDVNGDALTYTWTLTNKPSGSVAVLSDATSARPTFTADAAGTYEATLRVSDASLSSPPAVVVVTASRANAIPVANAGQTQTVKIGGPVTLDGSKSSDANGDALTYKWSLTARPIGSLATINDVLSIRPSFSPDVVGTYVASLVVSDGIENSEPTTVTIQVGAANVAPVADPGVNQVVSTGTVVTLDGSNSSDANGDQIFYKWTLTSKPSSSTAEISNNTSAKSTILIDALGSYTVTLNVNDGVLNGSPKNIAITADRLCGPEIAFGNDAGLQYNWSLEQKQLTIRKLSGCDRVKILATSTPLCSYCTNHIVDVFSSIRLGETLKVSAAVPVSLSWRPEVIYSTDTGLTYAWHLGENGTSATSIQLLLLDHQDLYEGVMQGFSEAYVIDTPEQRIGDCGNFSWIDRKNGRFRISKNSTNRSMYCSVSGITGYTSGGVAINFQPFYYFVTDKSKIN